MNHARGVEPNVRDNRYAHTSMSHFDLVCYSVWSYSAVREDRLEECNCRSALWKET